MRRTSYPETVPVKDRDVIKTLEKAGWRHVQTSGDHRVFGNPDGHFTVVPEKIGDDVSA
jgi:predicted RNA binding protein YcfA (HicA-like mRNA interferase family)